MKITRFNAGAIGVWTALASAFLFGAGTPLAKGLLGQVSPWLLAGLLYAGSGLGLLAYRLVKKLPTPRLNRSETLWLLAAVVCGGGVAPVLLMFGLSGMAASHASLLLNAEAVFTALGLREGWIPASAGFQNKDEAIPISPVRKKTAIAGRFALSTSLAFGGTNAAIVIGREADA